MTMNQLVEQVKKESEHEIRLYGGRPTSTFSWKST